MAFVLSGHEINVSSGAASINVSPAPEEMFSFTLDGGVQPYLGDDPNTLGLDESADDTITYTINGSTITVPFTIEYEGYVNHAQGNGTDLNDPHSDVFTIVTVDDLGNPIKFVIFLDPQDPPASLPPADEFGNNFLHNGNHRGLETEDKVICFLRGTGITTENGDVLVEDLAAGDIVATASNGNQKIRWIGSATRSASRNLSPIRIKAGALGENTPAADLLVSPAHRMLVSGWRSELLFGEPEALVPAKALVNDDTITVARDLKTFEYFHILFDNHEIVMSNGAPSESFQPCADALGTLDQESRDEVLELFPELANAGKGAKPVRPVLSDAEASLLL